MTVNGCHAITTCRLRRGWPEKTCSSIWRPHPLQNLLSERIYGCRGGAGARAFSIVRRRTIDLASRRGDLRSLARRRSSARKRLVVGVRNSILTRRWCRRPAECSIPLLSVLLRGLGMRWRRVFTVRIGDPDRGQSLGHCCALQCDRDCIHVSTSRTRSLLSRIKR